MIVAPAPGFSRPVSAISGTASDTGTGVLKVEVRIQRANGNYWNGTTWVVDPTGNQWKLATGTTAWSYPFSSPETSHLTISVRATDGMGLQSPLKAVSSTGAAVYKNVYRFRNLQNGYYLWSADENEKAYIIGNLSQTWKYEGPAYVVNTVTNTSPLWRFRNIRGGFYLYSADPNEKNTIVATLASVWQLEGEAYKVSRDSSGRPVWRFRNKQNGTYLLSADPNEKNTIVNTLSATWQLEGPAFYLAP